MEVVVDEKKKGEEGRVVCVSLCLCLYVAVGGLLLWFGIKAGPLARRAPLLLVLVFAVNGVVLLRRDVIFRWIVLFGLARTLLEPWQPHNKTKKKR